MKKYKCLCCGYRTLDDRGSYDICPVCFWEDEPYLLWESVTGDGHIHTIFGDNDCENEDYVGGDVLDRASDANHGLTLRQGRKNYKKFGACTEEMIIHCRKPLPSEMD